VRFVRVLGHRWQFDLATAERSDRVGTGRNFAVAIALSIAFGFAGGAGSMQRLAEEQSLSGTTITSKRLADGKEWTTSNLNVDTSPSWCYHDAESTAVAMAVCTRGNRHSEDVSRWAMDGGCRPTTNGVRWRRTMVGSGTIRRTKVEWRTRHS
jgi:hypothetical protein